MKKIIICLFCLIAFNAHATEMCARRDTTVIPLDATVPRSGSSFDRIEWIWSGRFDYGDVYGTATCLSLHELREITGNPEFVLITQGAGLSVLPTDDYELMGFYGYYNNDTSIPEYERTYCFCKLTHPMSSRWVYCPASNYGSAFCINFCADYCSRNMDNIDMRRAMFNSIGK